MIQLQNEYILLRALEPTDLSFLYLLENDAKLWEVSNTVTPYSKYVLENYLENAHRDIYEVKQLRLVICEKAENTAIGFIDFYEFDPKHNRVGIGIVIFSDENKRKGYAKNALNVACSYAFSSLDVHQIYAGITNDNIASISLFESLLFKKAGIKKDWLFSEGNYKDEIMYQLFKNTEQ